MPLKKKNTAVQKIVKKQVDGQPASKSKNTDYIATVGRRKTAIARIRLFRGKGDNTVNGRSIAKYFGQDVLQMILFRPLDVASLRDSMHFTVKVVGGGLSAQAEAVSLGLARAIVKLDGDQKKPLRDAKLLTRDSRMRETRKMGTGGKARRAKQSPKR